MIGIFGGTFDPIHLGHLRTALEVKQALRLERVHFIPCFSPPHRAAPHAGAQQRLALVEAALQQQEDFIVDPREIQRGGPSYMIDTLQSLRAEYPQQGLCLIIGMDAFYYFDTWKAYLQILDLAHVVVMHRPGGDLQQLQTRAAVYTLFKARGVNDPQLLQQQPAGFIWVQPVTALAISATAIRAQLANGEDIRYLVPDQVRQLIQQQGLYQ
jgi:nicotinate-nucleotide adenylyltransferase